MGDGRARSFGRFYHSSGRYAVGARSRAHRGSPATRSQLDAQDAYAFWIAGFVLLSIVLARAMSRVRPGLPVPRPTSAQLSTVVAWLIIGAIVLVVLLTRHP